MCKDCAKDVIAKNATCMMCRGEIDIVYVIKVHDDGKVEKLEEHVVKIT